MLASVSVPTPEESLAYLTPPVVVDANPTVHAVTVLHDVLCSVYIKRVVALSLRRNNFGWLDSRSKVAVCCHLDCYVSSPELMSAQTCTAHWRGNIGASSIVKMLQP